MSYDIKSIIQYMPAEVPENLEKLLSERAKQIDDDYLELPENLPQRVKDLSIDITKNCDNNYDKLKAIEAYLNKYTYTLTPGEIPAGKDVVDYFLFEKKEGYCTYFASAMAVMARCIGVPTRYVQGFSAALDKPIDYATYTVKSRNTHAWVEAYFEGVGWIPFEPTSSFTDIRYFKDTVIEQPESHPQSQPYLPSIHTNNYNNSTLDTNNLPSQHKDNHVVLIIIFIFIFIIIIFVGIVLYFMLKIRKATKQYDDFELNSKLHFNFQLILKHMEKCKLKIKDGETLLSYSKRVSPHFKTENVSFLDISKIFMKVRYGNYTIKEKELVKVLGIKKLLEDEVKERIGKVKYLIYMLKLL